MVIYSKVVGSTFCDGQKQFETMKDGEHLLLRRDLKNEHDINAVSVHRNNGIRIGYLKAELARDIAPAIDAGVNLVCKVEEITGRLRVEKNLGCNIRILGFE